MFKQIKHLGKHTFIYAIGSAMQTLVGFILIPVYTHYLSPADYGKLEILNTILLILTMILSFGFASAILKVHERDCKTEDDKKKAIGSMYLFVIPSASLLSIVIYLFSESIANILLGGVEYSSLVNIVLVSNITAIFLALSLAVLRTKERSVLYIIISFLKFLLMLGMNMYFVIKLNWGIAGVLLGNLIAQTVAGLMFIPQISKYARFVISKKFLKKLFAFGLAIIPAAIAMWIMDLSDRYYIEHFSDFTEVGLYSLGYKVGMVVSVLLVVPFQLAWPTVSFALSKRKDVREIFSKVLTYFLFISSFFALGLSFFAPQVIELLSPPDFYRAAYVVPLIAFSYVLYGAHFVISPGIHIREKSKYYPLLVGIPAIINLGLNFYFVPRYGMMGAAFTTLVCFVVMVIFTYFVSNHFYQVKYEWKRIIKLIIVLIIAIMFYLMIEGEFWQKIAYNLLILSGFIVMLFIMRFFEKNEISKLISIVKNRKLK